MHKQRCRYWNGRVTSCLLPYLLPPNASGLGSNGQVTEVTLVTGVKTLQRDAQAWLTWTYHVTLERERERERECY